MNAISKIDTKNADVTQIEPTGDASPTAAATVAQPARKRKSGRYLLMAALPILLAVGGGYVWATGGRYQETENASLRQARINIASDTAGRIIKVFIGDNAVVKAGDPLFQIDPEPYRIAVAQADAALAAARLTVEQYRAAYSQAVAQKAVAAGEVDYLRTQLDRQADLSKKGVNTQSALDQARHDLAKAQDEEKAAAQGVESAKAALGGDPEIATNDHPAVLAAQAARDKAAYDFERTTVKAPSDGVVSQASSFKVGQFVGAGTALFSLVETGDAWVEANFKETQLTNVKTGQPAEFELDTYPGKVFHGTVEAVGAGTGAEFSLLPAQNATGNWVKVTQRIPVRIKVDADAQQNLILRTGMSADVSVDTGKSRGLGSLFAQANASE
jgi:membrane fusion protein (multidrug efflux system)